MNEPIFPKAANQRCHRLAGASAALAVNVVLLTSLAGLFHASSRMPWLAATEANAQLLSRCDKVRGAAPHQHCVEEVVTAVASRRGAIRVAEQGSADAAPR